MIMIKVLDLKNRAVTIQIVHRDIEGESVFVGLRGLCQGAARALCVPQVVVRRLKVQDISI